MGFRLWGFGFRAYERLCEDIQGHIGIRAWGQKWRIAWKSKGNYHLGLKPWGLPELIQELQFRVGFRVYGFRGAEEWRITQRMKQERFNVDP